MSEKNEENYQIISSIEMKAELEAKQEKEERIYSNIPSLDIFTGGFAAGELIIISGYTKHGKTLFAQSLTAEFTKQNYFPLWFSFEVAPKYFLNAFPKLPLFYLPRKLKSSAMDWVITKIYESHKQYYTKVIFIDHLHYLFDLARVRNPSIEIGTIIRKLKTIAVNNGSIIFLLCHTKKGASEGTLSYDSIRDSSFVSQESDCVLLINRDTKNPESNKAKLKVEFHRRTGVLNKVINLVKVDGYLREVEKTDV